MTLLDKRDIIEIKELTKAQRGFLDFCQEFGWGKLEVEVKHGEPVLSREIEHAHKHD